MLEPDYIFSDSGFYYPPDFETLAEFQEYAETFPIIDPTEIFAMHENANLIFEVRISRKAV